MTSEITEEYLEAVYDLTQEGDAARTNDIAERMRVSPASATEMVQRLSGEGYLSYERYKGVSLTEKGMAVAKKIKRKHRLVERFLVDVLGAKKGEFHDEACRLEHAISDESERRICQIVNNPRYCPDGDPIPECEVGDCHMCQDHPCLPLAEMREGQTGEITHLKCEDSNRIRRLISMGLVPGRSLMLEERTPMGGPLLVRLGESRVALAKDYADLVMVQPERSKKGRTKASGSTG
ncbi:MAG TPA: metal-dependent transcriptional regulator [Methanomassiliicoccales archaeon]|nr:metal-dependent transcriptional regulator [Methanomassiliicoccales archaeon]